MTPISESGGVPGNVATGVAMTVGVDALAAVAVGLVVAVVVAVVVPVSGVALPPPCVELHEATSTVRMRSVEARISLREPRENR